MGVPDLPEPPKRSLCGRMSEGGAFRGLRRVSVQKNDILITVNSINVFVKTDWSELSILTKSIISFIMLAVAETALFLFYGNQKYRDYCSRRSW